MGIDGTYSRFTEESGAEGNVDCRGPAQEPQRKSDCEGLFLYLGKEVNWFLPLSKKICQRLN